MTNKYILNRPLPITEKSLDRIISERPRDCFRLPVGTEIKHGDLFWSFLDDRFQKTGALVGMSVRDGQFVVRDINDYMAENDKHQELARKQATNSAPDNHYIIDPNTPVEEGDLVWLQLQQAFQKVDRSLIAIKSRSVVIRPQVITEQPEQSFEPRLIEPNYGQW
jgi:hypothetical protein